MSQIQKHLKKACVKLRKEFVRAAGDDQSLSREFKCIVVSRKGFLPPGNILSTSDALSSHDSDTHVAKLSLNEIDSLLKSQDIYSISKTEKMHPM